jgi:streptogramin lyase
MMRRFASLAGIVFVLSAAAAVGCSGGGGSSLPMPTPQPSPQGLYVGNCPSGGQLPSIAYYVAPAGLSQTPGFVSAPIPGGTCVGGLVVQNGFTLIAAAGTAGVGLYNLPITGSSTPVYVIPAVPPNPTSANTVAVDQNGRLYVGDALSGTIYVYTPPLLNATAPAFSFSGLNQPAQMTFDGNGSLWIAECGANTVVRFDQPLMPNSVPALTITLPGALQCPRGVAFDALGNLYVAARNVNAIYAYSPPFTASSLPAYTIANAFSMLSAPQSLALDNTNRLFVANGTGGLSGVLVFQRPFLPASVPTNVLVGVTAPTGLTAGP